MASTGSQLLGRGSLSGVGRAAGQQAQDHESLRTSLQLTPVNPRAMLSAKPVLNRSTASRVNAIIAPIR